MVDFEQNQANAMVETGALEHFRNTYRLFNGVECGFFLRKKAT